MTPLTPKEMAANYYPKLWNKQRLIVLVKAGKLSAEEYEKIAGEAYETQT